MKKKIVYLTGTRADFGKLKSLIEVTDKSEHFESHIFVTGMHMNPRYGKTVDEITKCGFSNVFKHHNHVDYYAMDSILSKTVEGFSYYVKDLQPDLIVLHGDRVEALAGAIVGAFNNILTAHIEGGEISGTIDEFIRHSVSKLCHIHFVSNAKAKSRLLQMGEDGNSIFVIGSPDIDLMRSSKLPSLTEVKKYYDIPFDDYSILIFHPVTTEYDQIKSQAEELVNAVIDSNLNFVVIYPNNDMGSEFIFYEYNRFKNNPRFRVFPSLRFEYFLVLLKNSRLILGNSSCGIIEAPYYGVPTVNIGSRQNGRSNNNKIITSDYKCSSIKAAVNKAIKTKLKPITHFGNGNSAKLFLEILNSKTIWNSSRQKIFCDIL